MKLWWEQNEKIKEYIGRLCDTANNINTTLKVFTDMMNYLMAHPDLVARAPPFRAEMRVKAAEIFNLYVGADCPYDQGVAVEAADTARAFLRFLWYVVPLNEEFVRI
jgi:hypothetical protein